MQGQENTKFPFPRKLRIDRRVEAIEIDLRTPKLFLIWGINSKGKRLERHLKVTESEKLTLV